jgi:hypothetical protein
MRIAVDTAVWRVRSIGALMFAGLLTGSLLAAAGHDERSGIALALAAAAVLPLALARSVVVFRSADAVCATLTRTLALLSLPHVAAGGEVDVRGILSVRVTPLRVGSLVRFSPAGASSTRERYLTETLLKYQRAIVTIPPR